MNILNFNNLFDMAIEKWPLIIKMESIRFENGLHSIDGLYEIHESIVYECLGLEEEVILVNMHNSIYTFLLYVGRYVIFCNKDQIRKNEVKNIFKIRIEKCIENKFQIYDERDILMFEELLRGLE